MMPRVGDYTLLWWAEGPPHILGSKLPPATSTLCFQSGSWGLAFDTKQVHALRAGEWTAPDNQRLNESVHGNDFWQTDHNPATQRWQQTYNIALPVGQPHTIRFAAAKKADVTRVQIMHKRKTTH